MRTAWTGLVPTGLALWLALCLGGCDFSATDKDGDGYPASDDCDDGNPLAFPGAPDPSPCDSDNLSCSMVICDDLGAGRGADRDGGSDLSDDAGT